MPNPTYDEILAMEAGPELDALIATEVMGWKVGKDEDGFSWWGCFDDELNWNAQHPVKIQLRNKEQISPRRERTKKWSPSTDIAAAWEVVEETRLLDRLVLLHDWESEPQEYELLLIRAGKGESDLFVANGITAPLAICRAALLTTLEAKEGRTNDKK